ncbi:hypothetical protein [Marinifilum fragile]|uniref:hypothetical protein n=1 Tax=Marinifilum fragile TaxID=570161 RepID=UPI002AA873AC|nr:hypothetical protein [Marinifilum fragile]
MTKFNLFLISFLSLCSLSNKVCAQTNNKKDIHQTIIELDFSFKLHQHARNKFNESVDIKNNIDNFMGVRYTNAFKLKKDLTLGFGLGLEIAPTIEIPVVIDVRKYFGQKTNKSYLNLNLGKTYNGYSEFKTWLSELGVGRNIKIGEKTSLNLSTNYQLTYLKKGEIRNDDHRDWVKNFFTSSLAIKIGLIF